MSLAGNIKRVDSSQTVQKGTVSSKDIFKLEKFTQQDKENLYKMYLDTYSKIEGERITSEDFMKKFPDYYDVFYYQKGPDGEIQNGCLCNRKDNENGVKICLIFGKIDRKSSDDRIEMIKELLLKQEDNMYVEASGPLAAVLLKDERIPVSLVTEGNEKRKVHYSSIKTKHGKKITFGYPKLSSQVSDSMRDFYVHLYEYFKLKLKLKKSSPEELSTSYALKKSG